MGKTAASNKLRIGFLSSMNYFDRLPFSGIPYCMYAALREHADVVPLGRPYAPNRVRDLLEKVEQWSPANALSGSKANSTLMQFGRQVERQLKDAHVDFVFAPVASKELMVVESREPIIYASDVTCRLLYNSYNVVLSVAQLAGEEAAERLAIGKSTAITYPSGWAAESAMHDYSAPQEKIRIIPYGANLLKAPDAHEVYDKCDRRPVHIVFIGLNWHRKGGDIALKAFEEMRKRGLDAKLTFIGAEPPEGHGNLPVRVMRFLNKRKERDKTRLREIMLESHLMLFPSRADCSPIALCEAAAYGIPAVAADVGGISSIVTEKTGRLMPSHSTPEEYAAAAIELLSDREHYRELVRSSRQRYEEVLNWDTWAQSLLGFCEQLI